MTGGWKMNNKKPLLTIPGDRPPQVGDTIRLNYEGIGQDFGYVIVSARQVFGEEPVWPDGSWSFECECPDCPRAIGLRFYLSGYFMRPDGRCCRRNDEIMIERRAAQGVLF